LAGWVLDIPFLKGPVAGLVQMKADTAIGFLALGVALVLRAHD
jgi:two-component system, cell cycle sensor histidine kinase and response regulator CckA